MRKDQDWVKHMVQGTNPTEQCKIETEEHIAKVKEFIDLIMDELAWRSAYHDSSKLEDPEFPIFVEYTPKLKESTYGSDKYKQYLKEMDVALKHHYKHNRHHPEHFENGVKGMTLVDLVEMICDWKAATLRHGNGDITKSIEYNKTRFNLSDDLVEILKNTAKLFN